MGPCTATDIDRGVRSSGIRGQSDYSSSVRQRPTIPGTIAVVQLQPVLAAFAAIGGDPSRVLALASVSADELRDPHARVAAGVELAVWHALEQVSGDPLIGVRLAEKIEIGALGGFGYLIRNSSSLRHAVERANRFERLLDDLTSVELIERGEQMAVRLDRTGGYPHPARGLECLFAVLLRVARTLLLPGSAPHSVCFRHPAPPRARELEPFFGCPAHFAQAHDELVFPRELLDLPLFAADPVLAVVLEEHMQRLLESLPREDPFVHRARGELLQALQRGGASLEAVAEALHVSPRTLRRRLEEHGTSYKALLDELRRELAYHYVGRTGEPPDAIAARLGFTEPSTFYRAFKRWSGTTPALFRANAK
jgi:AraC-like DNA-binding protein